MRGIFLSFFLLIPMLYGCASFDGSGSGGSFPPRSSEKFDVSRISSFIVGQTTKAQVIAVFGKPGLWETNKDGTSYLMYGFVGPGSPTMYQEVQATFHFDSANVLTKIELPKQ
jgi:hypothetical protein